MTTKTRVAVAPTAAWRNRITGAGEEAPDQLLANPANWRIHPKAQQAALAGALDQVGWVQQVLVNQRSGFVVWCGMIQGFDHDGPDALARLVSRLADAAVIDTRVLLAHRLGPDESAWPPPEGRFASDLLLPGSIADPWLRALTESAAGAAAPSATTTPLSDHPVLLGGHTMVNGGLRLLAQRARAGKR